MGVLFVMLDFTLSLLFALVFYFLLRGLQRKNPVSVIVFLGILYLVIKNFFQNHWG